MRVLQVELLHARLSGLGNFGFSAGGATPGEEGSRAGGGESAARAAIKEAAELRRCCVLCYYISIVNNNIIVPGPAQKLRIIRVRFARFSVW